MKIVNKSLISHPILQELMQQELEVLAGVEHPNIMRVYDLIEDQTNFYIVTEIINGGELFQEIVRRGVFDELSSARIVKQILLALNYMHKQNIIHRDLKPENVLLQDENVVKLADFGFSVLNNGNHGQSRVLGSPLYMAPEIIRGETYGSEVDIWAVGVIACILLTGRPPFYGKSKRAIY